jgi:hypothetical protein
MSLRISPLYANKSLRSALIVIEHWVLNACGSAQLFLDFHLQNLSLVLLHPHHPIYIVSLIVSKQILFISFVPQLFSTILLDLRY